MFISLAVMVCIGFVPFLSGKAAVLVPAVAGLFILEWLDSRSPRQAGTSPWFRRVAGTTFFGIALVLAVCLILDDLWHGLCAVPAALSFAFPVDPMEGREALKGWLVAQGVNIYSPLNAYPYLVTIYGPLYYLLNALLLALGAGSAFLAAKMISLIAHFLLGAMLFIRVLQVTRSPLSGGILAVLWLALPYGDWAYRAKPDVLAWLLAFGGLLLGPRLSGIRAPSRLAILAGVLLALAVMTKQQTLPAAMALVSFLILGGAWRAALVTTAACSFSLLGIAGLAQALTGGNFLVQYFLFPAYFSRLPEANSFVYVWDRLFAFGQEYAGLLLIAVVSVIARRLAHKDWLYEISLGFFLVAAAVSLRWTGSSTNNFIGVGCLLVLLASELAHDILGQPRCRLAGLAGLLLLLAPWRQGISWDSCGRDQGVAVAAVRALPIVAGHKNILVSTEAAAPFLNPDLPKNVRLFDAYELQYYNGFHDFDIMKTEIISDIKARTFAFITFSSTMAPEAVRSLRQIFYEPLGHWENLEVVSPRSGDIALVNDLTSFENYGWGSAILKIEHQGLARRGATIECANPIVPGVLMLRVKLRSGQQRLDLICHSGIFGFHDFLTIETSLDGATWMPWVVQREIIGYNQAFWRDYPTTYATEVNAQTFFVRFTLGGTARLWFDAATPMALVITPIVDGENSDSGENKVGSGPVASKGNQRIISFNSKS